jgi:two-component system, NarL family, response regulator LiaR
LMDLEMKQVNGLQATRQILACYPQAQVIIVTNFDDPALRTQAQAAGARAFVMKEQMTDLARILQGLPSSQNLL